MRPGIYTQTGEVSLRTYNLEYFYSTFRRYITLLCPGVLSVLRVCGVYVRHHLPSIHPRPMAVFRRQHLRMGPVCLAHRSVQLRLCQQPSLPQSISAQNLSCQVSEVLISFSVLVCRKRSLSADGVPVDPVCVH